MRLSRRSLLQMAAGAVALSAVPPFASAQAYPTRPVRIVVGFPPGAPVDTISRLLGEKLAAKWGQPVVVENRPGATGNIGVETVARADPDGYTLLFTPPTVVINPLLNPNLPFDASKLTPVTVIASFPNVLVIHPKVSAASLRELIALANKNPDRLNYASSGNGSTAHLTAELFKLKAGGLKITHVPYKGGGPLMTAMLAGEADMLFFTPEAVLPHVRAGRLKALAVLSERRIAALPDVPAMSEIFPGFVSITWWGVLAPPKTPMPIAEKLSAAIAEMLRQTDLAKRLAEMSADPIGNRPAEMTAFLKEETERWAGVIRSADIKPD